MKQRKRRLSPDEALNWNRHRVGIVRASPGPTVTRRDTRGVYAEGTPPYLPVSLQNVPDFLHLPVPYRSGYLARRQSHPLPGWPVPRPWMWPISKRISDPSGAMVSARTAR